MLDQLTTNPVDEIDLSPGPVGALEVQPDWALAADNHNVASGNPSWYEHIENIGESLLNAPKFTGLALASGVTGILNSGIAVGNWVSQKASGTDLTSEINFGKWISDYDTDLGKYYRENANSIDTWGFIGTSLIPGTLGVKALNLGQKALRTAASTGQFGKNLSFATNLVAPSTEAYIANAARTISASNGRLKLLQADSMKAIGAGFGQASLEAAAFETFAFATGFRSSFFDDMEAGDIALNAATGILLGGGIGGLISAAGTRGAIKAKVLELDQPGKIALQQIQLPEAMPAGAKASQNFLNRETTEAFIARSEQQLGTGQLPTGVDADIVKKNIANAKATVMDINNQIRTQVHTLADVPATANAFADTIIGMGSRDGANMLLGTERIFRVADQPKVGILQELKTQLKLGEPIPSGTGKVTEGVSWNKIWGDEAGKVFEEAPKVSQLADYVPLKGAKSIKDAVDSFVNGYKFTASKSLNAINAGTSLRTVQARYAWAAKSVLEGEQKILVTDFPLLEAAFQQFDKVGKVTITGTKGKTLGVFESKADLLTAIQTYKDRAAQRMITRDKMGFDEISERLNMKPGFLDQTGVSPSAYENYFYKQGIAAQQQISHADLFSKPSYMGVKADRGTTSLLNEFKLDAETLLASQRKAAIQVTDNAVEDAGRILGQSKFVDSGSGATGVSNLTQQLPETETLYQAVQSANRAGAGARLFMFSNGNYGSLESMVQHVGNVARKMTSNLQTANIERLNASVQLLRTDSKIAADWAVTRERIAQTGETYVLRSVPSKKPEEGLVPALVPKKLADGGKLDSLNPGSPDVIHFADPRTASVWEAHIGLNAERQAGRQTLRAAQGLEDDRVVDAAYAIKPDPRRLPYFAFVTDPAITGAGKTSMIHAGSAEALEQMITKIGAEFPQWRVIKKSQSDDYFKALGEFDYDKTLHENYIDSSLRNRGINNQRVPRVDGDYLAQELIDWHNRQAKGYVADVLTTKYETAFRELEAMGRVFGGTETSRYADMHLMAMSQKSNPYVEYVKTALNISNIGEYPLLTNINQTLDRAVSNVWNQAADLFSRIRGVEQGQLDAVNKVFADHGFKTAYSDAASYLLANHSAEQSVLTKFVRGANSILATTLLRMDWLNAINNKLGSTILTSTELRDVIRGIEKGDQATVGKLASIAKVKIPDSGDFILSPNKLMMRAYQNFFNRRDLVARYVEEGFVPAQISDAFKVLDNLTVQGGETGAVLNKKLAAAFETAKKIGDFGETWTGNRFVEQLNRFVSTDIMRQLTDIAVESGSMTAREAKSYINTFLNRTQVNLNPAQRPLAFQGPIGMAMGLFQSYQLNMMQQLFRYVQPGARKTAAFMTGMQGSIYGMNGLPGFQAFNEHIIAQAAGNHEHIDVIDAVREGAGYDLANLFLYGMPSNLLRANLYTRGDLTPQHPTIIPTSPVDFPVVSAFSKFLGNMKGVVTNMSNGAGMWNSVLAGIEHNSINRPLAGLAQTLRGIPNGTAYSTDRSGNLLSTNDLFSISTLARLAGGKPLDEAITRDQAYRIQAYRQSDMERRNRVTGALRLALANDGQPSDDAMESIYGAYLNTGGKSSQFNKWYMTQFMNANVAQSSQLANKLSDPYSQRMLRLMDGGNESNFRF